MQSLDNILVEGAVPKPHELKSYGNFRMVTQNPNFLKRAKGGPRETFKKIAQKVALIWKAQKHSGANGIIH